MNEKTEPMTEILLPLGKFYLKAHLEKRNHFRTEFKKYWGCNNSVFRYRIDKPIAFLTDLALWQYITGETILQGSNFDVFFDAFNFTGVVKYKISQSLKSEIDRIDYYSPDIFGPVVL